jgi:DNA-binding transcriptional ArsR family regulator
MSKEKKKVYPETINQRTFSVIPAEVLFNPKVNGNILMVYCYMKMRYNFFSSQKQNKPYFESHSIIAKATGLTPKTVLEAIKVLEEIGHVKVVNRGKREGQSNTYETTDCRDDLLFKNQGKSGKSVEYIIAEDDDTCPF